jgi:hypothetical protein
MKIAILIIILVGLAFLVPLSSHRPDAIEHVLGLPGGVDKTSKAVMGILVAAVTAMSLVFLLKQISRKKR